MNIFIFHWNNNPRNDHVFLNHLLKKKNRKGCKITKENKIDIFIGDKLFTSFLYPDSLEKPVLYPVHAANGTIVTRGFPLNTQPNDPTDHPHHIGIWFTFENVNGLDFWNNSYAIPKEKKHLYGWIKTDKILGNIRRRKRNSFLSCQLGQSAK